MPFQHSFYRRSSVELLRQRVEHGFTQRRPGAAEEDEPPLVDPALLRQ
jgi:hypothetical protein